MSNNLTDNIVQWKIADVLRKQDWQTIKVELLSLPASQKERQQWKYWYARSLLATTEKEQGLEINGKTG